MSVWQRPEVEEVLQPVTEPLATVEDDELMHAIFNRPRPQLIKGTAVPSQEAVREHLAWCEQSRQLRGLAEIKAAEAS